MQNGLLFANAAVKTMESRLFGAEKLGRLTECDNLTDAVRILREGGFGAQSDSDDYESMLLAEERTVESFVRKNAPKGAGFECFWLKTDYHNLKTALKAKYYGMDDEGLYLAGGNREADEIKDAVFSENGKSLGEYMDKAVVSIVTMNAENALTPKALDEECDRAMYAEIAAAVSARGIAKVVKDYFRAEADLTNVLSFRRTAEAGMDFKAFEKCFVTGGAIPADRFQRAYKDGTDGSELLGLAGVKSDGAASTWDMEKAKDEYLLRIMTGMANDMFTVQPIMGYYLIKKAECRVVRTVMAGIANGLSREEIKRRIIKIYA